MPKTYNDLYLATRTALKSAGVEAYALEARLLVAYAVGKTKEEFVRDLRLYTSDENEQKIRALLYVGGGLHDWQKMKALNTLLYSFVRYPEELEAFAEDPPRMAVEWLRRSLQTM